MGLPITDFNTFVPLTSALIGGIAAGLWNKFNNQRADAGVRRQIQGYAGAVFSDLTILATSMRVGHKHTLPYAMNTLIVRAHEPDVAVALNARQAQALYESVNSLIALRSWFADEVPASTWQDLPELARDSVHSAVCCVARLLITFGDDITVQSLIPGEVRNSRMWTTYVLEPSLIDKAWLLRPLINWSARRNLWTPYPTNPAMTEKLRRLLGARWPAPTWHTQSDDTESR